MTHKDHWFPFLAFHRTLQIPPCVWECCKNASWALSALGLDHFPGDPIPVPNNPLGEELFPNIELKPPHTQLSSYFLFILVTHYYVLWFLEAKSCCSLTPVYNLLHRCWHEGGGSVKLGIGCAALCCVNGNDHGVTTFFQVTFLKKAFIRTYENLIDSWKCSRY